MVTKYLKAIVTEDLAIAKYPVAIFSARHHDDYDDYDYYDDYDNNDDDDYYDDYDDNYDYDDDDDDDFDDYDDNDVKGESRRLADGGSGGCTKHSLH